MRDPNRMDKILKAIEDIWIQNPDLRLTQLIMNSLDISGDPYYIEDDILFKSLKRYKKEISNDTKCN